MILIWVDFWWFVFWIIMFFLYCDTKKDGPQVDVEDYRALAPARVPDTTEPLNVENKDTIENMITVAASWLITMPSHKYTTELRAMVDAFIVDATIAATGGPQPPYNMNEEFQSLRSATFEFLDDPI